MTTILLGVYGTLKQGHHNHDIHLFPKLPLASEYFFIGAKMYTNGRYPMLVKSDQKRMILLEIYEITKEDLKMIDDLEYPFGYHREELDLNNLKNIWIYFYSKPVPPPEFKEVENGNFIAEKEW